MFIIGKLSEGYLYLDAYARASDEGGLLICVQLKRFIRPTIKPKLCYMTFITRHDEWVYFNGITNLIIAVSEEAKDVHPFGPFMDNTYYALYEELEAVINEVRPFIQLSEINEFYENHIKYLRWLCKPRLEGYLPNRICAL